MELDTLLLAPPGQVQARAEALAATGVDGLFTFEGPHDVFLPLVSAAATGCTIYTNIAVAFPRSPMHLAHTAWDLSAMSGGRFALGLGTQVRAHVERRYGTTWSAPVDRMREWIGALRSIWATWQHGEPLAFEGDHTTHTLMSPAFTPAPLPDGPPPIWLGALGPRMTALATSAADGLLIHPFTTEQHVSSVTAPRIAAGLGAARRPRSDLTVVGQAILACGRDADELEAARAGARWLVGFYGSTPAYRSVLESVDRGHLQPELRDLSRSGSWEAMAALVDDELLDQVVASGGPDEVAERLRHRFPAGSVERLAVYAPGGIADETLADLVRSWRRLEAVSEAK